MPSSNSHPPPRDSRPRPLLLQHTHPRSSGVPSLHPPPAGDTGAAPRGQRAPLPAAPPAANGSYLGTRTFKKQDLCPDVPRRLHQTHSRPVSSWGDGVFFFQLAESRKVKERGRTAPGTPAPPLLSLPPGPAGSSQQRPLAAVPPASQVPATGASGAGAFCGFKDKKHAGRTSQLLPCSDATD